MAPESADCAQQGARKQSDIKKIQTAFLSIMTRNFSLNLSPPNYFRYLNLAGASTRTAFVHLSIDRQPKENSQAVVNPTLAHVPKTEIFQSRPEKITRGLETIRDGPTGQVFSRHPPWQ